MRVIQTHEKNGGTCTGDAVETSQQNCGTCPAGRKMILKYMKTCLPVKLKNCSFKNYLILVNCAWENWSSWSTCSITCGTGTKTRSRRISVHEENGGTACSGDSTETSQVNCGTCPAGYDISYSICQTK